MKKLPITLLTMSLSTIASVSLAQTPWNNAVGGVQTTTDQNVSIGLNSYPADRLRIHDGDISFTRTTDASLRKIKSNTLTGALNIFANTSSSDGPTIEMYGKDYGTPFKGSVRFISYENNDPTAVGFAFSNYANSTWSTKMSILKNGNVGIGSSVVPERLTVNGNIAIDGGNGSVESYIKGNKTQGLFRLYANNTTNNGPSITMFGNTSGNYSTGAMEFISTGVTTTIPSDNYAFRFTLTEGGNHSAIDIKKTTGNVGIGMTNPTERLTINGNIAEDTANANSETFIRGNKKQGRFLIYANTDAGNGPGVELCGVNSGYSPGSVMFVSNTTNPNHTSSYNFQTYNGIDFNSVVRIYKDGKMAIGDGNTSVASNDYLLFVKKGILTEKIKVALSNDPTHWSDFVFNEDYKLMPLSEVETFVKKNNHLPEIPSAKEVFDKGLDLAEMDAKLLQKVEELTLYIIEQQKQIQEQQKQINKLTKQAIKN